MPPRKGGFFYGEIMNDETKPDESQVPVPATAETAAPGDQQPQETPADEAKPEAEAQPEGDGQKTVETPEAVETEKKRKQSARERINELTRQKRDAERDAENWKAKALSYEDLAKDPDSANYDDLEKLETDRAAAAAAKIRKAEVQHDVTDAEKRANEARATMWSAKVTDFKEDVPDFDQVALTVPLSDAMAQTIPDLENGPAVAYWLGKNHVEAARIAQLPEREQAIALGRIEGQLSQKPVRRTTQAPEPVQTVGGKSPTVTPNLSKMSMKEYAAYRNKQMGGS